MITNFILIMVVLKLASSVPQRDKLGLNPSRVRHPTQLTTTVPTVILAGPSGLLFSNGSLVQLPCLGCTFGHTCYRDGDYLDDTCLALQCSRGTWTNTVLWTKPNCGQCLAHGDPHMNPYENNNLDYSTFQTGDFALTQPGFIKSELFGINIKFEDCAAAGAKSCVHSIHYYEPGINVRLELPPSALNRDYCGESSTHANEPRCAITLLVNEQTRTTPTGLNADSFTGTDGTVLVFKQDHISGQKGFYCIAIVGSKGFSMALCQHYRDWSWFYVYAMPSLKRNRISQLQGLCDVWTGLNPYLYTMRNRDTTADTALFVNSWRV